MSSQIVVATGASSGFGAMSAPPADAGTPVDTATAQAYEEFYSGLTARPTELEPADADPTEVARAVVRVVDMPYGTRPPRTHVDPSQDGAEVVDAVADRPRFGLLPADRTFRPARAAGRVVLTTSDL
ncbi:hypothetical protein [Kutzneria buriramensis]|uniref:Uncharacterized protein n=1 Tax=Kutzneria buriramensis TaxID=1045776 RepID=A0A3E0I6N0_9PSEU|nr:hypothetical protein [Kutzneria buriramensis]REH54186.1 hypothetical protein BCF44_102418 [Kutzneria buriramensis]